MRVYVAEHRCVRFRFRIYHMYTAAHAVILNIRVILSIIERVSIKRLTEDLLLIIDGCRNT